MHLERVGSLNPVDAHFSKCRGQVAVHDPPVLDERSRLALDRNVFIQPALREVSEERYRAGAFAVPGRIHPAVDLRECVASLGAGLGGERPVFAQGDPALPAIDARLDNIRGAAGPLADTEAFQLTIPEHIT